MKEIEINKLIDYFELTPKERVILAYRLLLQASLDDRKNSRLSGACSLTEDTIRYWDDEKN